MSATALVAATPVNIDTLAEADQRGKAHRGKAHRGYFGDGCSPPLDFILGFSLFPGIIAGCITEDIAGSSARGVSAVSYWVGGITVLLCILGALVVGLLLHRHEMRKKYHQEIQLCQLWQQRPHAITSPHSELHDTFMVRTVAVGNDMYAHLLRCTPQAGHTSKSPDMDWQVLAAYQLDYIMAADQVADLQLQAEAMEQAAATDAVAAQQHQQDLQATVQALQPKIGA